ncbi:uncharacterized protein ASPGLDRAFT_566602 [Aspergillus glaucus CBS 516.65]|uniref:Uncharacterized protein n=1 Tax=Aspergillus glaucus CBS 516.65 TaxID=1160497 RepID=A0A1L9VDU6_ASPGL|nr:hypothetical protein ASPGLDRAFT_566602 [Aspergillus glaucus CBS 516.65]OJJ82089.1 hypothetical protein ASPGLDRAFT_566602 [Aspergillus glaucus CBS 516.65]
MFLESSQWRSKFSFLPLGCYLSWASFRSSLLAITLPHLSHPTSSNVHYNHGRSFDRLVPRWAQMKRSKRKHYARCFSFSLCHFPLSPF